MALTDVATWLRPLPIAWLAIEDEHDQAFETATCFFNGCADGGRPVQGAEPRRQAFSPYLAIGIPTDSFPASCIRSKGEVIVHTATRRHDARIASLVSGGEAVLPNAELVTAQGVSVRRIADAPVAFSCKLTKELDLGNGDTAFILQAVAIFIHKSVLIGDFVDSAKLQSIAAFEPSCNRFVEACEEHTMHFPDAQGADGLLVVPDSSLAEPPCGDRHTSDIDYRPPLLPSLRYNPLKALVVPRPIGWISTRGDAGDNLSPYSFFGYLAADVVFFGAGGHHVDGGEKDALKDARESGFFCVNSVSWDLRMAMSASSADVGRDVDEFCLPVHGNHVQLEKGACERISAPCVANAPLRLECRTLELVELTEDHDVVVVGRIVHVAGALRDEAMAARGGYMNYFRIASEHAYHPLAGVQ